MLVNSLLLTATAAVSLLPSLVHAAPATAAMYHEDGSVEIVADSADGDDNGLVKRRVMLTGFQGCSDPQKEEITAAWRNMLDMGALIQDKINFNEMVAIDFLGHPSKNKGNQHNLQELIKSVVTWQLGGRLDWHLKMRCDDPARARRLRGSDFPDGCPSGALREDFDKCASPCWVAARNSDNSVHWKYGAMAYTENFKSVHVGQMNWCPGWFSQPTCLDAVSKWSRFSDDNKWNMINYQCREQSMVHELFHIDANWQHHAPGNGHIMDRKILIKDPIRSASVLKKAYGPLYTKVLARWTKNVGHYVGTNADNLAFYFLGKWIQEHSGYYPSKPTTDQVPLRAPQRKKRDDTPDIWDPIRVVDGEVVLGDLNDLADALGVESNEEAQTLYDVDDAAQDACLNFAAQDENDENPPVCANADEPLDLDPSQDVVSSVPGPAPTPPPATSCVYTVMTFDGVTEPGVYTLPPTVDTLCLCNENIQAGIATVTADDSSRYLVCLVEGHVTVSTLPPEPTADPQPPPPPPPPQPQDPNSPDCLSCGSILGASTCPGDDQTCLIDQCKNTAECQSLGQSIGRSSTSWITQRRKKRSLFGSDHHPTGGNTFVEDAFNPVSQFHKDGQKGAQSQDLPERPFYILRVEAASRQEALPHHGDVDERVPHLKPHEENDERADGLAPPPQASRGVWSEFVYSHRS
ncbi:hypothetical protein ACJZ2D_003315 [Fusarium nematophilum]